MVLMHFMDIWPEYMGIETPLNFVFLVPSVYAVSKTISTWKMCHHLKHSSKNCAWYYMQMVPILSLEVLKKDEATAALTVKLKASGRDHKYADLPSIEACWALASRVVIVKALVCLLFVCAYHVVPHTVCPFCFSLSCVVSDVRLFVSSYAADVLPFFVCR